MARALSRSRPICRGNPPAPSPQAIISSSTMATPISSPALQKFQVGGGCWCGPAYYAGASGGIVFYQAGGDVLRSFGVDTSAHPKLTQLATGTTGAGYGGSFPIVSSNGSAGGPAVAG